jgi:hypothetical protein
MRGVGWALVLLGASSVGWASGVHTNPLNRDPLVREAYQHFYDMDYPGAVERFERFHAAHPGDPQGTVMLLEAALFQELYRQDLLDTTFYANDGFLTGRHATAEDPKVRDRIFALADETIHESDWRIGKNPNDTDALYAHLYRDGRARLWRRVPAGHEGQGRRSAGAATGPGLRGRQAGGGGV